ncbi:cation:proton antiporter family protein [Nocardioides piscis]|uniref:Cation:proton antiporter n=1 Tax=Nocardioides piscis TaxID=2714938 RepID=A0A6G7YJ67_9ACTN|nr:cation:proton antiporter family protein [Nocardioides piscis]QIK76785.1 cation:proton antiporter [Nocardioides piscis]
MGDIAAILTTALGAGLLASVLRLPPLVGFLAAGFALSAAGVSAPPLLDVLASLGVTLLLFGIGLKLDLRVLVRSEVWLTASAHMALTTVVAAAYLGLFGVLGVGLLADQGWQTLLLVGFALSFSSTVFVVKTLEERGGTAALSGRTAIGILIVQDLAAVAFLAATHEDPPSLWAFGLVLLIPAALLVRPLLDHLGHDELRPLFGLVAALVPGYALFEAVGLKGDLGALVVGILLAPHAGSEALSKSLFSIKEILLVGFFLSVGFTGLPTLGELLISAALLLLLPLKAAGFAALLWTRGLRRRTSVRTATTLGNFSEFGLIVAVAAGSGLGEEWLGVLATTVAASFLLSAVVGRHPDAFVELTRRVLPDHPVERLHADDRPIDVGDAEAVVLGMGRVGRAAYERLTRDYGLRVVGVEDFPSRQESLVADGLNVVLGDATDPEFWARMRPHHVQLAVLAMPFHTSNVDALRKLQDSEFAGTVAVVAQYDDDLEQARALGAHTGFQLYDGVGAELADRAADEAGLPRRDGG